MKGKRTIACLSVIVLLLFLLSSCGGSSGGSSGSQSSGSGSASVDFPTGPIEILVSAGAGGGSDLIARAIAAEMTKILRVPVNILNMPSGGGVLVLEEIYGREADGHTMMMGNDSSEILSLVKGDRELGRIDGLATFAEDTSALHVKEGGKYNTIEDFIAAAKANPGKLTVGSQGALSMDEFMMTQLSRAAGIEVTYVPYDQTGQFQADVLGGHIDAMLDEIPPTMELMEAGQIRTLLVFAEKRLDRYPDIPCTVEMGWDITDGMHRFLTIKKGTPREIIDVLVDVCKQVYDSESYQEFHKQNMYDLKDAFMGYEETNAMMDRLFNDYSAIFKELNFAQD